MRTRTQKQIIAVLLLLTCGVSIVVLAYNPDPAGRTFESLDQLDTNIDKELDRFNISASQIEAHTIRVNEQFKRKNYRVEVAPSFSKTQFHYELQQRLWPLGIRLPADLSLPYNEMRIHLYLDDTIVRSIRLQTDPELASAAMPVSMMILAGDTPSSDLMRQLVQIAEPIPVVIPVTSPLEAREAHAALTPQYTPVVYWIRTVNQDDLLSQSKPAKVEKVLNEFHKVLPEATYLAWNRDSNKLNSAIAKSLATSRLDFIYLDGSSIHRVENSNMLSSESSNIITEIKQGKHPTLVLPSQTDLLNEVYEQLLELKKKGVQIVTPPPHDY